MFSFKVSILKLSSVISKNLRTFSFLLNEVYIMKTEQTKEKFVAFIFSKIILDCTIFRNGYFIFAKKWRLFTTNGTWNFCCIFDLFYKFTVFVNVIVSLYAGSFEKSGFFNRLLKNVVICGILFFQTWEVVLICFI